tara:strand:+ start:4080 stop:5786 length:1707 start_codon:yes stop_codon:yes gene_type:complete
MSDRITYDDKELYKESSLPENQKFTYLNANEIKSVVDSHATDIEALQASPPGSGDMNKADYDPANINEQLVGTTAIQSLTNKTVNNVVLNNTGTQLKSLREDGTYQTIEIGGATYTTNDGSSLPISPVVKDLYYNQSNEILYQYINDGTSELWMDVSTVGYSMAASYPLVYQTVVTQSNVSTTLGGVIDSTKEYLLDGVIDCTGVSVEVPATGINIKGYDFNTSGLVCSDAGYTLFTSPVGGSGNVLFADFKIEVTGAGSKVYNLEDSTGFNAIEITRINYNNCQSLGDLYSYRQGLESGTGRFGGSPSLTLHGTWVGGFRISTSICRGMSDTTTEPLFKAGTAFVMDSRFLTDINCDLGTLQPFCDFTNINFPNPSTVQVKGAIISRKGVFNSGDSNIFTNLVKSDLASDFDNNIGIDNTFVGGRAFVSSENLTNIASGSTYYTLNGIWGANNLQHFDSPSGGQLRHLGNNPREFKVTVNFAIESTASNDIGIRLRKWDNLASSFSEFNERARQINSFVGGRDVGFYNFSFNVTLGQNDYVYFQVRNNTGNNNLTLELDSDFTIEER